MVKKRRTGPSSGGKVTVVVKEERMPSDHITNARDRLRGALHSLLDPTNTTGSDGSQKHQQSLKRKQDELTVEQLQLKQEEKRAAVALRRRQRRAEMSQVPYHNSYVMKLFDRSVDLAQFKEGTPLYPICRAWIANQPRNPVKNKSPSPEPKTEPLDDLERSSNGVAEGMDVEGTGGKKDDSCTDVVKDVYKLPLPVPFTFPRYPIRKPERSPNLEFDFNDSSAPSRETLLKEHIARWTEVHNEWINTARENENRYKQSGRILKAIYEQAQKSFES